MLLANLYTDGKLARILLAGILGRGMRDTCNNMVKRVQLQVTRARREILLSWFGPYETEIP